MVTLPIYANKILESKSIDSFRMCSLHFSPDSYIHTSVKRNSLSKDALPTIFLNKFSTLNESGQRKRKRVVFTLCQTEEECCASCGHVISSSATESISGTVSSGTDPRTPEKKRSATTQTRKVVTPHRSVAVQCKLLDAPPLCLFPSGRTKIKSEFQSTTVQSSCFGKAAYKVESDFPAPIQQGNVQSDLPHVLSTSSAMNETLASQDAQPSSASVPDRHHLFNSENSKFPGESMPNSTYDGEYEEDFKISDINLNPDSEDEEIFQSSQEPLFIDLDPNMRENPVREKKYIVFDSCLDKLFRMLTCQASGKCSAPITQASKKCIGSAVSVYGKCANGHSSHLWDSQPKIGKRPIGNIQISAAILCSGSHFLKVRQLFNLLSIQNIGKKTYYRFQKDYLFPTINYHWLSETEKNIQNLKDKAVCLAGDGRSDGPGHSAKYCVYTMMDVESKKILAINVQQLQGNQSSVALEKTAFQGAMDDLLAKNVNIKIICTDRNTSIPKAIRKGHPTILHKFDIGHVAKSIGKKILSTSKRRGCGELAEWSDPIKNHLWWCSKTCRENPDLLLEKWNSLVYHVINVHQWPNALYYEKCSHPRLPEDKEQMKNWLRGETLPHNRLKDIVQNPRLLRDLKHLSRFSHTGELEIYHSSTLKYRPKSVHFSIDGLVARTQLSALDHNRNVNRVQASVQKQFQDEYTTEATCNALVYSKGRKEWIVRAIYETTNQEFLFDLIKDVLRLVK